MNRLRSVGKTAVHIFSNLKRLLKISWQADKFLVAGYYVSAGLAAIFPIFISYFYKLLVDSTITNQGNISIPSVLLYVLGGYYLISITQSFVRWGLLNTYFDYLLRWKLQNKFNLDFYEKVANLDIQHFENPETQDLITKAKDTVTWRVPDFIRQFSYLFSDVVAYIATLIILLPYSPFIPLILSLIVLPRLYLRARFGRLVWSIYGAETPNSRKMWYISWLLSNKTSVFESKIFQSTDNLISRFKAIQERLYEENKKPVNQYLKILVLPEFLEVGITFAFAIWWLPAVLNKSISVGDYTFFISLLSRLVDSAGNAVLNFGEMYADNLYVDHYFDVLNLKKLVAEPEEPIHIDSKQPPKIEFKNVSFSYPGSSEKALDSVSFTFEPKQNLALVGANGAGKTTIVKLMCRFYDVDEGEVLINGISIKKINIKEWYSYLGTLFQEFIRYDMTVRENIMLGDPDKKDEAKMIEAAEKSGAADFINDFPEKYNQLLGRQFEGGKELSIGQWQKLAIARAFYEGAPILILDEPTSAIDAETEYKIFKNINKFYRDRSLLFISHRFSTVRNADKIIVLKRGKILELGTHHELLRLGGLYARMFKKQALGYQ